MRRANRTLLHPALVALLAVCAVGHSACSKIIRETADLLGVDDLGNRSETNNGPANVVTLLNGSHRTVEGNGPVVLTIVRKNPDDQEVTVDFRTLEWPGPQRAISDLDFVSRTGTLHWGPKDGANRVISIPVMTDAHYEGTEVFQVEFSNVKGSESTLDPTYCYIDDATSAPTLAADVSEVSAARGGVQKLTLRAGPQHAGRNYLVAGSFRTSPGFELGGLQIPLNNDAWFAITLEHRNGPHLHQTAGVLDVAGQAEAEIRSPPLSFPNVVGVQVHHAYVVYDAEGYHMVSNPVSLAVVR